MNSLFIINQMFPLLTPQFSSKIMYSTWSKYALNPIKTINNNAVNILKRDYSDILIIIFKFNDRIHPCNYKCIVSIAFAPKFPLHNIKNCISAILIIKMV